MVKNRAICLLSLSANVRSYAVRRVRDAFKENQTLTDPKAIKKQLEFAKGNLNIVKRQVLIGNLYKTEKLVIENLR
nr:LYR motif-containing protein 4 isoform X2 [Plodia interpunctella]